MRHFVHKTGPLTTDEVYNILLEEEKKRETQFINYKDLEVIPFDAEGQMYFKIGKNQFQLSGLASNQFHQFLGVPERYAKKCPSNLGLTNYNHWMEESPDAVFRLRIRGNEIFGITTEHYKEIKDVDFFEKVAQKLSKLSVRELACNGERTIIRLTEQNPLVGKDSKQVGEAYAGVQLMNSEFGTCSLSMKTLLFILVCTNGLIIPKGLNAVKSVHRGEQIEKFVNGVDNKVDSLLRDADGLMVASAQRNKAVPGWDNDDQFFSYMQGEMVPKKFTTKVLEEVDSKKQIRSAWNIGMAITHESQKENLSNRAVYDEMASRIILARK